MKEAIALSKNQLREDLGLLYLKIAVDLRRLILEGRLPCGQRLRPLNQLAIDLGVAVVTVRKAVAVLEKEGLLRRYPGKGTFVSENVPDRGQIVLASDWNSLMIHLKGTQPRLLSVVDESAQPLLEEGEGERVSTYRYMKRVHYRKGCAYAVTDIYLDQDIYDLAAPLFDTRMVIPTLISLKEIEAKSMRQSFRFTTADPDTARLLKCRVSAPIGDVRRVISDRRNRVIYVGEAKYLGDLVRLEMNIERE